LKSRDVIGKFWTVANERFPRAWMHRSTNQRTHICAVALQNDAAFFTCEPFAYRSPLLALSTVALLFFSVILSSQCSLLIWFSTFFRSLVGPITWMSRPIGLFISYVRAIYFKAFTPSITLATIWTGAIRFPVATEMLHFTFV
jgi:hypothetical protein